MTDFAGIGRLCSVAHCQIKDWLPFDCAHCHSTFCLNHRSHFAHDCAAWAALHPELTAAAPSSTATASASASSSSSATPAPQRSRINPYACTLAKCHKRELQRIVCRDCQMQFCIEHRFSTDHNCAGSPAAAQPRILQQHKDRAAAKANAAKALEQQSTATATATATAAPSVSATAIASTATAGPATAPAASLFHAPRAATTNLASRSKLLLVPEQRAIAALKRAQLSAAHNEHAEHDEAIANPTAAASTSSTAASAADVKASAASPASASSTSTVVATTAATVVAAEPIPVATYIIPSLFGDDEMSSYAPALTLPRAAAAPAIAVPTAAAQTPSTSCAAESATAASVLGASVNTKAWVVVA